MDRAEVRRLANLVNGSTALGALIARIGGARLRRGPRGLILAEGYRLPFPVASAFTVGNVVISPHRLDLWDREHPGSIEHEERHATQYAYLFGLPFFPAYVATMAWSWLRTGDRAAACFFEQEAGLESGLYRELPRRPLAEGVRAAVGLVRRGRAG